MNELIIVYITHSSAEKAAELATILLQKKLIACANIIDTITSQYWWNGAIAQDSECLIIVKTVERLYSELVKEVREAHTYQVPCIIKISATANEEYAAFISANVKHDRD